MSVEQVVKSLGSVARTGQVRDRGVSARELARAVRGGAVVRLRSGVLALPGADPDLTAAVLAGGRLTCVSAARYYGLWQLRRPGSLHLSCTSGAVGCVNHRGRTVPVHPILPVVGLIDVLVHALQCRPAVESVAMVECALRRGDTVKSFLAERLPGNRNGRARAALDLAGTSADSAIEVVARLLFLGAGLDIEPQAAVPEVGRVDFLVEGFLVVEIDGAAFHSDRRALRRDRHRNNRTIINGYAVLRFCYEDIMFHQELVLADIFAVLRGRAVR